MKFAFSLLMLSLSALACPELTGKYVNCDGEFSEIEINQSQVQGFTKYILKEWSRGVETSDYLSDGRVISYGPYSHRAFCKNNEFIIENMSDDEDGVDTYQQIFTRIGNDLSYKRTGRDITICKRDFENLQSYDLFLTTTVKDPTNGNISKTPITKISLPRKLLDVISPDLKTITCSSKYSGVLGTLTIFDKQVKLSNVMSNKIIELKGYHELNDKFNHEINWDRTSVNGRGIEYFSVRSSKDLTNEELASVETVEMYKPSVHGTNIPKDKSFYCYVTKFKNGKYQYVDP